MFSSDRCDVPNHSRNICNAQKENCLKEEEMDDFIDYIVPLIKDRGQ